MWGNIEKRGTLVFVTCVMIFSLLEPRLSVAAEVHCLSKLENPSDKRLTLRQWPAGFQPAMGACWEGYLEGPIVPGDYEKVRNFMRTHHKTLGSFSLNSPGGNVLEALKIGRLFRRYLISATAPFYTALGNLSFTTFRHPNGNDFLCGSDGGNLDDCTCASACALIWLGAVKRYGSAGFHRPRIVDPQFVNMSPSDASAVYRDILRMVEVYMEEMEAPRALTDLMISTSSADLKWVSGDDEGFRKPPSISEWLDAGCGAASQEEIITQKELWAKEKAGQINSREQMLKRLLDSKFQDKFQCETLLLHNHRVELEAP